jgi:hypothetical protein
VSVRSLVDGRAARSVVVVHYDDGLRLFVSDAGDWKLGGPGRLAFDARRVAYLRSVLRDGPPVVAVEVRSSGSPTRLFDAFGEPVSSAASVAALEAFRLDPLGHWRLVDVDAEGARS